MSIATYTLSHVLQQALVEVNVMDTDESGAISKKEFCHSVLQITEGLRPLSMIELHYMSSLAKVKIERCEGMLFQIVRALELQQVSRFSSKDSRAASHSRNGQQAQDLANSKRVSSKVQEALKEELSVMKTSIMTELRAMNEGEKLDVAHYPSDLASKLEAHLEHTKLVHSKISQEFASLRASVSTQVESLVLQRNEFQSRSVPAVLDDVANGHNRGHEQHSHLKQDLEIWKASLLTDLELARQKLTWSATVRQDDLTAMRFGAMQDDIAVLKARCTSSAPSAPNSKAVPPRTASPPPRAPPQAARQCDSSPSALLWPPSPDMWAWQGSSTAVPPGRQLQMLDTDECANGRPGNGRDSS